MKKCDLIWQTRDSMHQRGRFVSYGFIEDVIDTVFNTISASLEDGENVSISGFGSFKVVERAERVGRNPRENTPVIIPKRKMPVFTPSDKLKKRVSGFGGEDS